MGEREEGQPDCKQDGHDLRFERKIPGYTDAVLLECYDCDYYIRAFTRESGRRNVYHENIDDMLAGPYWSHDMPGRPYRSHIVDRSIGGRQLPRRTRNSLDATELDG